MQLLLQKGFWLKETIYFDILTIFIYSWIITFIIFPCLAGFDENSWDIFL